MIKSYLVVGVILASFFYGCSSKKKTRTAAAIPKKIGRLLTDSVPPPVVTMITATNAPQIIKATAPKIVPLSYPNGVGVPGITNYGIADGLSSTFIGASAIDQQGNIWFTTNAGICKFDGTDFVNYHSGNGLGSDYTKAIFIDSKNNIWIDTENGLSIFDGRSFSHLVIDKDISGSKNVRRIIEDVKGRIWLGTTYGLYLFTNNRFSKFTTADGLPDNWINNIVEDKNGNLLISTEKGISNYDGKSFASYTPIPSNRVGRSPFILFCDSKGCIWFNDGTGQIGKYDGKQIKIYTKEDGDSNRYNILNRFAFWEDKAGNFWIGGFNGLTKFDGNRFILYASKQGLNANQITSLTADTHGNFWLGTQNKGIYKIDCSSLTRMDEPAGKTFTRVIDREGTQWVIGSEGLGKYYRDHIAFFGKEQFTGFTQILFVDHRGNIWFQVRDRESRSVSLLKFDGKTYTIFGKDQGMSLLDISNIMEDSFHNLWLAGSGNVLKYDGYSFSRYDTAQGFGSRFIYSVFQDSKNNMWFGSSDAGVYKFDGRQFTVYDTSDGIPHNFINGITEDGWGNIWLATDGGAAKLDARLFDSAGQGGRITSYKEYNGLANVIQEITYDSVNKLIWFGTSKGLASLELEKAKDEKPYFLHFNRRTGFDLSSSSGLIVDSQGVFWGRDVDFFRFDYGRLKDHKPIPVRVRNIRLDNKNICWSSLPKSPLPANSKDSLAALNEMVLKFGKAFSDADFRSMSDAFGKVRLDSAAGSDFIPVNLVLPYKNNTISFEFGSISSSFGKAVQYQYQLEGYSKEWSELSNKKEASFGNMREGNYTFRVKALSPFGSWSETSFSFKVLPPWHRTWWAYSLYVLLLVSGILVFIRWRTKALKKEKTLLEEKVSLRTAELNQSLENLKATQSQLIQSEKMASLGELTAGIAHEIQNPLNFVNNFSEVNTELIEEAGEAMDKGNISESKTILNDIKENEQKIRHHGKRADAIVKGMLQHSRSSNGVKEPTDINALADEYLRLAYHGLRAKDNRFNATIRTDFDESVGNINIVPQDIGRVILNLINNAFYAATQNPPLGGRGAKHEPTVWLSTKKVGDKILISVRDNGPGIPQKVLDKIFQPFFTTKPTGEGTGLGLSLSYDIVKAHGGDIKVNTRENEGTEFIIQLPIN